MSRRRSRRPRPPDTGLRSAPLPAAGLFRRLAALLYDAVLLSGVLFAATLVLLPLRGGQAFAPNDAVYSLYLLAVGFGFFGWFWTHGGQTLGMRAWKIRLVAVDGGPVSWRQAWIRYAVAPLSLFCFGLGFFWASIQAEGRSWHDLAAGTRVVRVDLP